MLYDLLDANNTDNQAMNSWPPILSEKLIICFWKKTGPKLLLNSLFSGILSKTESKQVSTIWGWGSFAPQTILLNIGFLIQLS